MTIRGKFTVQSHKTHAYWAKQIEVTLGAVYDTSISDDQRYAEATPSGQIVMNVKASVAEQFPLGKQFYVDFVPVDG